MKTMIKKIKDIGYTWYLCGLAVLTLFLYTACEDDEGPYPFNSIEVFSIMDTEGNTIEAVIRDQMITIQWPPFQEIPETITPDIIVSERATISPASGETVAFGNETVYTVTAEDGSTQTYTLDRVINAPRPTLLYANGDPRVPYWGELSITLEQPAVNEALGVIGEHYPTDPEEFDLFLVDRDTGTEYLIPDESLSINSLTFIRVALLLGNPAGIEPGWYYPKLVTEFHTVTLEDQPFYLNPPRDGVSGTYNFTIDGMEIGNFSEIQVGQEMLIEYFMNGPAAEYFEGNYVEISFSKKASNGAIIDDFARAPVISDNDQQLVFNLPDAFEPGDQIAGRIRFLNEGYLRYDQNLNGGDFVIGPGTIFERSIPSGNPITVVE